MSKPLVSIVIPTLNSERFLEKCLASVNAQTYGNVEVILVDSFSADKTRKIAERYGARIVESRAKRSEARSIEARKATGELVFFVDSDMELTPKVLHESVAKVESGFDVVIIPEISG